MNLGILYSSDVEANTEIGVIGDSVRLSSGKGLLKADEGYSRISVGPGRDLGGTLVEPYDYSEGAVDAASTQAITDYVAGGRGWVGERRQSDFAVGYGIVLDGVGVRVRGLVDLLEERCGYPAVGCDIGCRSCYLYHYAGRSSRTCT